MSYTNERRLGFRDGVRATITWLHKRAKEMNDPHATLVLNNAAFMLGVDFRHHRRLPEVEPLADAPNEPAGLVEPASMKARSA